MARTGTALDSHGFSPRLGPPCARQSRLRIPARNLGSPSNAAATVEQYGGTAGLIEGNAMQVVNQIEVIVFVYDAIVSLIIRKTVDIFIGLRVSDEVEHEGLDLALHGEIVH